MAALNLSANRTARKLRLRIPSALQAPAAGCLNHSILQPPIAGDLFNRKRALLWEYRQGQASFQARLFSGAAIIILLFFWRHRGVVHQSAY